MRTNRATAMLYSTTLRRTRDEAIAELHAASQSRRALRDRARQADSDAEIRAALREVTR